jgi:RNA polymerase sigma-70 factor (ECF subfamily)
VNGLEREAQVSENPGSLDRHAMHRALTALRPRLRRFAYGLCGSAADADDLVQSAYERALKRLDQWQEGTRLDSWMYRIVQTVHFNRRRAERVQRGHLEQLDDDRVGMDAAVEAEGQITLDRVRRCVSRLPEDQRACLLLVVVEGLSYQESAQVLGIPVGTLTSRLARARSALKTLIEGPARSPPCTLAPHGGRNNA